VRLLPPVAARNDGRTVAKMAKHVEDDPLVH
jgi:hypothetical protein